jgi:hypothetical protein
VLLLRFSFESKQPWPTLCTRCELGDQSGRDFSVRLSAAQLLKRNKKTTKLLGPKVTTNIDSFISNQEIFQGCEFDVIGWKENCTTIASDIYKTATQWPATSARSTNKWTLLMSTSCNLRICTPFYCKPSSSSSLGMSLYISIRVYSSTTRIENRNPPNFIHIQMSLLCVLNFISTANNQKYFQVLEWQVGHYRSNRIQRTEHFCRQFRFTLHHFHGSGRTGFQVMGIL